MPSVPPSPALFHSLLRPPIIQILRAAGFQAARPTVVDTVTDLAARYLLLLARTTAAHVELAHPETPRPTLHDLLHALTEAGALQPQLRDCEEWARGGEDLRGVEALVGWMMGEHVGAAAASVAEVGMGREVRRIAGFASDVVGSDGRDLGLESLETEDYLTSLKKKHSKTGEESRYQGTMIGKDAAGTARVYVEGAGDGGPRTIKQWGRQTRKRAREENARLHRKRLERERIEQERLVREREREREEAEQQRQRDQDRERESDQDTGMASSPRASSASHTAPLANGISHANHSGHSLSTESGSSGLSSVRSSIAMLETDETQSRQGSDDNGSDRPRSSSMAVDG
ncbi:hypothetical protein KEM52_006523 [Ascosphaera acerosa]|nr:hypothetical protein KEM52_006523 [Ascosphaera acerosa]